MTQQVSRDRLLAQRKLLLRLVSELGSEQDTERLSAAKMLIANSVPPELSARANSDDVIDSDFARRECLDYQRRCASGANCSIPIADRYLPLVAAIADDEYRWWKRQTWVTTRASKRVFRALLNAFASLPMQKRSLNELIALRVFFAKALQLLPEVWRKAFEQPLFSTGIAVWQQSWTLQVTESPTDTLNELFQGLRAPLPVIRSAALLSFDSLFEELFPQTTLATENESERFELAIAIDSTWNACELMTCFYEVPLSSLSDAEGAALIRYCHQILKRIASFESQGQSEFAIEIRNYRATIALVATEVPGRSTREAFELAQAWIQLER